MRTFSTVNDLPDYLLGISQRIAHHGAHWSAVVNALAFNVLAHSDQTTPMRCRMYAGKPANQIIVRLRGGREIRISYHPHECVLSIVDLANNASRLLEFTPDTPANDIAVAIQAIA